MTQQVTSRPVEVTGQVRGVKMNPPGEGGGGTFQLLLENGDVITSPYPEELHVDVGAALQSNDMRRAVVSGIGEYSPDGKLLRIREMGSFDVAQIPDWQFAFRRRMKLRANS